MNIGIKFDRWTSDKEMAELKVRAEVISNGNVQLHTSLDRVWRTMNEWAVNNVLDALKDGRITRPQALRLYDRLANKIVDTCMDTIPAPEE